MSRVDIWPIARKPLPLPRLKEIEIFMDAQQVEALSYSQALQALDDIVAQLEEGKVDFDSIKPLVQEADLLLRHCQALLTGTQHDVDTIAAQWKVLLEGEPEQAD